MESDKQNDVQGVTQESKESNIIDSSKTSPILPPSGSGSLTERDLEASPAFRRMQSERDSAFSQIKKVQDQLKDTTRRMADLQSKYDQTMLSDADESKVQLYIQEMNNLRNLNLQLSDELERMKEDNVNLAREAHYASAVKIARKFGNVCEPEDLLVAYSEQDMERLAKRFQSIKQPEQPKGPETPPPEIPNSPDSGTNTMAGGKRRLTRKEVADMDPREFAQLDKEGKIQY